MKHSQERGPGRPPLPLGKRRDGKVHFKLRREDYVALEAVAAEKGTTIHTLSRDLVERYLKRTAAKV